MYFAKAKLALVSGATALALCATPALGATQGTLGATSTGTVAITATVPNRTQITGLTDISFTNADPSLTATSSQSDCVWSNTSTKGYSIKATGSGTGGAFTLAASGGATVAYSVQWAGSTGQTSGTTLTSGTASTGYTSTAINPTCSSAPNTTSSLIVSIAPSELQSMTATASYTGTLTLLVTPQ